MHENSLLTKEKNQQTETWHRTIKPFTKAQVNFNLKILSFHQIIKLWSHLIDILFQRVLISFLKRICDSAQGEHVTNKGHPWLPDRGGFIFFSQSTLKMSGQLKGLRLFESGNYDVVSTYIGRYKCKGTRSTQCDHLETKLPGKENIIISKLDQQASVVIYVCCLSW